MPLSMDISTLTNKNLPKFGKILFERVDDRFDFQKMIDTIKEVYISGLQIPNNGKK